MYKTRNTGKRIAGNKRNKGNAIKHSGEYQQTIFHFLLRNIFETYQVYYTVLLIYRFRIHFYP